MKSVVTFFKSPWFLRTLGVLLCLALIWWVGPLIAVADYQPLAAAWRRWLLMGLVVLWVLVALCLREWRRRKAEKALLDNTAEDPDTAAAKAEADVLKKRFEDALAALKGRGKTRGGKGFFAAQAGIYDLPWYVFIGAPGSGKTTALMASGLTFPLAAKMGQTAAVQGVGGTRNCDWWFTEDAVLIDTAGRYTAQQSNAKVDRAAWERFLQLLRKSRPRRPLNGVLLTLSVQELLQLSEAERRQHAERLRARLQELGSSLGLRLPVYVLITKSDLLAGFSETFESMTRDEREQVLGYTLPLDGHTPNAKPDLLPLIQGLHGLRQRLEAGWVERLQSEPALDRRAAIFSFPHQLGLLLPTLEDMLSQIFDRGGDFDDLGLLRGVYFTSGTQEGTAIDRVMGSLSRLFGGRSSATVGGQSKSYFLLSLLKQVVFAEQALAGLNVAQERRLRLIRRVTLAACGFFFVLMVLGWGSSLMNNRAYIHGLEPRAEDLKPVVGGSAQIPAGDFAAVSQVLDSVRDSGQGQGWSLDAPPSLHGLGLYQGEKLNAAAQISYRRLLKQLLLPRVMKRSEELLRSANREQLDEAYESLKAYLSLRQPEHFDANALIGWFAYDWEVNFGRVLSAEQRSALEGHLSALFQEGAPAVMSDIDQSLVNSVRDMLRLIPTEVRVYNRLKRQRLNHDFPEFNLVNVLGSSAVQAFERSSGEAMTRGVPGLFTRDGYVKGFNRVLDKANAQAQEEEGWVLGSSSKPSLDSVGPGKLQEAVRALYLQEYIRVWDKFLADVRLVRGGGIDRSVEVARILASADAPLVKYIKAVAKETQLVDTVPESLGQKLDEKASQAKREIADLLGSSRPGPSLAPTGKPEQVVNDHFAHLHRLAQGQPAPVEETQKRLNELFVQLAAVDTAQKSRSAPPPSAGLERLKAEAGLAPQPVRGMMEALADAGLSQSRSAERQTLSSDLKPITEFCQRSVAGRYPFSSSAPSDVPPEDFGQLFGVGGLLDDFFNKRLMPLVDTSATPWAYRPQADGSKPAASASLADFQRAARIRDVFFRTGGRMPAFRLDVRLLDTADAARDLTLDWDGQQMRYTASGQTHTLNWPSQRLNPQLRVLTAGGAAIATFEGPWAPFRLFDRFEPQSSPTPERFYFTIPAEGKRLRFEVTASSVFNPYRLKELQQFRCPGAL
jgi:type VI secretion system protein ImpL